MGKLNKRKGGKDEKSNKERTKNEYYSSRTIEREEKEGEKEKKSKRG